MKQLVTLHRQALHTAGTPGPDDKNINIEMLTKEPVIIEAGVREDAKLVLILSLALLQQPSLLPLLLLHPRLQSLAGLQLPSLAPLLLLLPRLQSLAALQLPPLASLLLPEEDLHVAQDLSVRGHFPPFLHKGLHQGQTQLPPKLEAHLLIPRVQPIIEAVNCLGIVERIPF